MECMRCGSERILDVSAKTSDRFAMFMNGKEYNGYVPADIGIGGSDYMEFLYCLECGQIQDNFPVGDPIEFEENEDEDW